MRKKLSSNPKSSGAAAAQRTGKTSSAGRRRPRCPRLSAWRSCLGVCGCCWGRRSCNLKLFKNYRRLCMLFLKDKWLTRSCLFSLLWRGWGGRARWFSESFLLWFLHLPPVAILSLSLVSRKSSFLGVHRASEFIFSLFWGRKSRTVSISSWVACHRTASSFWTL